MRPLGDALEMRGKSKHPLPTLSLPLLCILYVPSHFACNAAHKQE